MTGTHNSLTGEGAWRWWMHPFRFVWRCQSKALQQQIAAGVRVFDIRCRWDGCQWRGAHGACLLSITLERALWQIQVATLTGAIEAPIVRLILEKGDARERERFAQCCSRWECIFSPIRFICGRYKPTWERLYHFAGDTLDGTIIQRCGSMDPRGGWRRLLGRIWPWGWHRLLSRSLPPPPPSAITIADFL